MRRLLCLLFCLLLTARTVSASVYTGTCELYATSNSSFLLPESLVSIEDSAFEGTAAISVVVPDSVSFISEGAFDNDLITVLGYAGSYADQWSRKHGIPFVRLLLLVFLPGRGFAKAVHLIAAAITSDMADGQKSIVGQIIKTAEVKYSMRPQDRAEMHAIENRFP